MKRLSDYKDDEAIDVVGELLEPMGVILSDEDILKVRKINHYLCKQNSEKIQK